MKPISAFRHIPLVLLFAFAVWVGLRGIDFGHHWDEPKIQKAVAESFQTGTLLPGWYNYPSVSYGIALAAAAPRALGALDDARAVVSSGADKDHKKERLAAIAADVSAGVMTVGFVLRARAHFLVLSLLSIVWVYLFVWRWRRSTLEAVVAAALMATSWEVGYHARWMAPDAVLMQFAALSTPFLLAALRAQERYGRWLLAAAVVAGLGAGTKYTGGVLLLPVVVVAVWRARESGLSGRRALFALVPPVLVFAAVFLVTTPGAVLQPMRFLYDVAAEIRHYQAGHVGHYVSPGPAHAVQMLEYLALVAFSPYRPIALLVFLLGVAGAVDVIRNDRRVAVVVLLVPVVLFVYLSVQRAMIVRNLLLVFPFVAALGGRGAGIVRDRLAAGAPRLAGAAALAAALAAGGWWTISASESIAHRAGIDHGEAIAEYLHEHPEETFYLSRGAWNALQATGESCDNVTQLRESADRVVIMSTDLGRWDGGRWRSVELVSGPHEVNLQYYIVWNGDPRVIATDPATADRMWFRVPADTTSP